MLFVLLLCVVTMIFFYRLNFLSQICFVNIFPEIFEKGQVSLRNLRRRLLPR